MSDDAEIRRENLRRISSDPTALRARAGGKRGYSYWAGLLNGDKSFGEKAARSIETDLRLPRGWLDHTGATPPVTVPAHASATPTDLAAALAVVLEAVLALPPARWASVRAQLEQLVAHPEMRDDVLVELQSMLQAPPGKAKRIGE